MDRGEGLEGGDIWLRGLGFGCLDALGMRKSRYV